MNNSALKTEQEQLLHEISILDFIVTDLTLFLDTHPDDRNALEYFKHYNRLNQQAKKEYSSKYGPLQIGFADMNGFEFKWATEKMPWEGGN